MKIVSSPELSLRYKHLAFSSLPEEFPPKSGGQSRVGVQGAGDETGAQRGDSESKRSEESIPAAGHTDKGVRARRSGLGSPRKSSLAWESEPGQGERGIRGRRRQPAKHGGRAPPRRGAAVEGLGEL